MRGGGDMRENLIGVFSLSIINISSIIKTHSTSNKLRDLTSFFQMLLPFQIRFGSKIMNRLINQFASWIHFDLEVSKFKRLIFKSSVIDIFILISSSRVTGWRNLIGFINLIAYRLIGRRFHMIPRRWKCGHQTGTNTGLIAIIAKKSASEPNLARNPQQKIKQERPSFLAGQRSFAGGDSMRRDIQPAGCR